MRFYLLDDDINMLQMLSNLIEDHDMGQVIKMQSNPTDALKELPCLGIDICIIDYLMPKLDGSSIMRLIQQKYQNLNIDFIMITQVEDAAMTSESYSSGAQLVIHKPLNIVEFKKVVHLVSERRALQNKLNHIKQCLAPVDTKISSNNTYRARMERTLTDLGMIGEKGAQDLILICEQMLTSNQLSENYFNQLISELEERPQTITQRMRRAIAKGLNTLAHIALEDFSHEYIVNYAYRLFDPQSLRDEIAYIKKQSLNSGKISLFQFVSSLLIITKD
jgi:two-component system response regulator YcbB